MESDGRLHPLLRATASSVPVAPQPISLVSPGETPGVLPLAWVASGWLSVGAAATSVCSWRSGPALPQSKHTLVSNSN